jgi:hypothetical protein
MNPSSFSIPFAASAMLFVGDAVALAARVVCAAPVCGVGVVDVPVCDGAQPVKSRAVTARRGMGFMRRSG